MLRRFALCLTMLCLFIFAGCSHNGTGIDHNSSVYWLPEESNFVDYEISGDCVRFRYRICFVNETEQDIGIKLSAAFDRKELAGWVESKDYFDGLNAQNEWDYQTVKASGKTQLLYTFEGKYLGGEVNTNLSFPEDLVIATASTAVENNNRTLSFFDYSKTSVNTTEAVTLTFIYGEENVSVTLDEDESEKVIDILNGNRYHSTFSGVPSCGFDENISLTVGSQIFAVARDTCHCMQDLGNLRYFDISQEDMNYIHSLFTKYGGYFPCV